MIRPTLSLTSILALCAGSAVAQDMNFNRIASFMVAANTPDAEETSAEIISATEDGMTLVYSDSPAGVIGFIDITDPANPVAAGVFAMPEGEPTAVAVHGMTAYAGENTSASFVEPSGVLHAIDVPSRGGLASCDSGRAARQHRRVAGWRLLSRWRSRTSATRDLGDGRVPQLAAGFVAIVPTAEGGLDCDGAMIAVDLDRPRRCGPGRSRARIRVRSNGENEIVVTLQENNHMVVLSADGTVLSHFFPPARSRLEGVDTEEEGALVFRPDDHRPA